jgi:ParB family chromosome partitioning protein
MVTKKPKGLGRGLEALLGPTMGEGAAAAAADAPAANPGLPASLRLDDMVPGMYQPRTRMDEGALYELAESIKAQGIMQPILVRRLDDEQSRLHRDKQKSQGPSPATAPSGKAAPAQPVYEIIAGERRFRAARLAGLDSVPVLVRDVPNEAAAAMALIENIQREDLNPLEEAQGLQRLIRDFGLTHEQAAQAVGRSRSAASNLLRLLNLADPVQTMLMAGDLDMGHARALLALERAAQITAANQITAKKLSVREAESLVKKIGAEFNLTTSPKPKAEKSRDLRRVEEELSDLLTAEVEVRVKKRAKRNGKVEELGEVAIQFGSLDELNGLIDRLRAG